MSSLKKIYLFIIGAIVILILLVFVVALPLVNKIETLSKEYADGQTMLSQIQQKELLLRQQEELLKKTQEKFSKVEKSFLESADLVNFIASLEKIAKDTKSQFEIKSVSPPDKEKQYFTFAIIVKNNFPDFLRFLFALENTPQPPYRLIEVKSLTLKGIKLQEGEEAKAAEVEGNLEIKVHASSQ